MYETDEAWEKEFSLLRDRIGEIEAFRGTLKDAESLHKAITKKLELERIMEKIFVYSHLRTDEDTTNSFYQSMNERALSFYYRLGEASAYLQPEALKLGTDKLRSYIQDENAPLYEYRMMIENLIEEAEHTLSEEEEALISKASEVTSSARTTYSLFNNADLRFQDAVDAEGNSHPLTHATFVPMEHGSDRVLRKDAYEKMYDAYGAFENTVASLYQTNVKNSCFLASAKKYPSNRAMYLSANHIPEKVYDQLLDTVHERMDLMHRYISLRKKLLAVDSLHFYDVYASLVPNYEKKYTFEEAKNMILEALKPMGEEYVSVVRRAFDERWMDIYENEGKRSGAYSSGCYDSYPYMLLNFSGTLDAVFTLIHEMGHSMHSYYTRGNQPYATGDYSIFVAEVASTCNESLLTQYLLKTTTDPVERKVLLNHYMESFKSTLYRQTMFAEFEHKAHRLAESGQPLTAPVLNEIYKELNRQYFGPEMEVDDRIAKEWQRIPHFYTPFYVYQYATGYSAAIALSHKILREGESAVQDYMKFLKGGSSKHPIDMLRVAGVDMEESKPIHEALDVFEEVLTEMENLV